MTTCSRTSKTSFAVVVKHMSTNDGETSLGRCLRTWYRHRCKQTRCRSFVDTSSPRSRTTFFHVPPNRDETPAAQTCGSSPLLDTTAMECSCYSEGWYNTGLKNQKPKKNSKILGIFAPLQKLWVSPAGEISRFQPCSSVCCCIQHSYWLWIDRARFSMP